MAYRPDMASLRSAVPGGCGFGEGTTLVRVVGPWPQDEPPIVFGGPEGVRYVFFDEPEED